MVVTVYVTPTFFWWIDPNFLGTQEEKCHSVTQIEFGKQPFEADHLLMAGGGHLPGGIMPLWPNPVAGEGFPCLARAPWKP